MRIKYIDYGLAYNYGDTLELHKGLREKKYRRLREKILEHEKTHLQTRKHNQLEIQGIGQAYGDKDVLKFIIDHPTALASLLPFDSHGNINTFDLLLYIFITIIILTGIYANPIPLLQKIIWVWIL